MDTESDRASCSAVLHLVFDFLSAPDLITAHLVCREWNKEFTDNPQVALRFHKRLLLHSCPNAVLPNVMPLEPKQLFLYRKDLMRKIKTLWATDEFHEKRRRRWLYHYDGKYSPEFIMNILWVVRLVYCYAPPAYLTMDGADTSPYNPEFSNYPCQAHAPGWNIKSRMRHGPPFPRDIIQSLSFEDNEDFDPKLLFESSYGGDYQSAFENQIQQLKSKPSASAEVWKKTMDLVEHTKLLSFILRFRGMESGWYPPSQAVALKGVMQDVYWLNYSGADNLKHFDRADPLVMTHLFNVVKLCHHVQSLSWDSCCGEGMAGDT